jgi:hypothetical protein
MINIQTIRPDTDSPKTILGMKAENYYMLMAGVVVISLGFLIVYLQKKQIV